MNHTAHHDSEEAKRDVSLYTPNYTESHHSDNLASSSRRGERGRDTMNTPHSTDCARVFRSYDLTCLRCRELADGAEPRKGWGSKESDADLTRRIRSHDCEASNCGPVCTAFDW